MALLSWQLPALSLHVDVRCPTAPRVFYRISCALTRYMATEPDDFYSSMRELGVSNADAKMLFAALLKPSAGAEAEDAEAEDGAASESACLAPDAAPLPVAVAPEPELIPATPSAAAALEPEAESTPASALAPAPAAAVGELEPASEEPGSEPEPEPEPVSEPPIPAEDRMRVTGRGVGDIWGEEGTILSWDDDGESCVVRIDGESETVTLKRKNVILLAEEARELARKAEEARRAPPEPSLIRQRVRIDGLSSAPAHNGQCGVAVSWDGEKQRYTIKVDGQAETLNVRPANLRCLAAEAAAAAAEAPSAEVDDESVELERPYAPRLRARADPSAAAPDARSSPPPPSSSVPSTADAHAAAAAAIAAASRPVKMVNKLTPNGYRLVPEDNLSTVMAALAAAGAAGKGSQLPEAVKVQVQPQPQPQPQAPCGVLPGSGAVGAAGGASSLLASALASVAALDASKLRADAEERALEPDKPKVRSFTQINHVVSDGDGGFTKQSSVERGTHNKALEAYKRRHNIDPNKGVVNFELDRGTMTDPEYKTVLARDEARTKKIMDEGGPNPYLGPQFNAI